MARQSLLRGALRPEFLNETGTLQAITADTYANETVATSETGTGAMAFGPLGMAGVGQDGQSGSGALHFGPIGIADIGADGVPNTGALAFGGVAMAGVGSDAHSGTGALAFGPIAMSGGASASHTGMGALAFAGIAILATGYDLGVPGQGKRFFWTF